MLKRKTNRPIALVTAITLLAAAALGRVMAYRFGWHLDMPVWGVPPATASLNFVLLESGALPAAIVSPLLALHFASKRAAVTKRIKRTVLR